MEVGDQTNWEAEGYVEKENGLLEKMVVEKLVHNDTCSLWFTIYYVGNKADYNEFPDGSWYEMEISNSANASAAITNRTRFYLNKEVLDNMLEVIIEAKPELKKFEEELEKI